MNLKSFSKALIIKAKNRKPISRKLAKSYASLFLVFLLGITVTFGWFTVKKTAEINSGDLEFQSASSLRINKEDSGSSIIRIDKAVLDEASSLDGRNIYLPLDKSFTTTTGEMYFREANAGDRLLGDEVDNPYTNNPEMKGHYVYKDFELKGTSGNTPVYIKSYEIKIEEADTAHDSDVNGVYHDQLQIEYDTNGKPKKQVLPKDNCPIRLAFIADSGDKPVVIDPSAQVIDYVDNSPGAVERIDENGVPVLRNTYPDVSNNNTGNNWNSFQSYYYGNTPLFVIPGGETLDVTLVVWLEGSLPNCDKYIGKKISVDIDIESNFPEMETVTFVDGSYGDTDSNVRYWVSNNDDFGSPIIACSYEDPYSNETPKRWKTVIMNQTKTKTSEHGAEWQAKIPKKAIENISFYRLSRENGSNQATIYNAWHTNEDVMIWVNPNINSSWYTDGNLQDKRQFTDDDGNKYNSVVYTAIHGNGFSSTTNPAKRLSPCIGYWDITDTSSGGSSGGGSGGSGGGSSETTYAITVNVETTNQTWIDTNVNNDDNHLYFHTSNGEKKELRRIGQNSFSWSGDLGANDEITSFSIESSSNVKYRTWTASPTFKVTANYNANFYVNRDNNLMILAS